MKNITYSILFTILLTITLNSDNISKSKSLDNLTTEQLLQELAKSEKKLEEEKHKTKAVIQFGKTVDKLAKTLKVDWKNEYKNIAIFCILYEDVII